MDIRGRTHTRMRFVDCACEALLRLSHESRPSGPCGSRVTFPTRDARGRITDYGQYPERRVAEAVSIDATSCYASTMAPDVPSYIAHLDDVAEQEGSYPAPFDHGEASIHRDLGPATGSNR